jgi:hypothetical protein
VANRIRLAVAVGFSVLVPSVQDAAAAEACASMTGAWTDGSGQWTLGQDTEGRITGTQAPNGQGTCPTGNGYNVTGNYTGGGGVFLTGTYTGSDTLHCAASITQAVTVGGAGCAHASGSWSNSAGRSGVTTMTLNAGCVVPNGETPSVFTRWSTTIDQTAVGIWHTSLQQPPTLPAPDFVDFGGRTVTETFDNNAVDTCYFAGSKYTKVTSGQPYAGRPVNLASKAGYDDRVGFGDDEEPTYFRQHGKAPCGYYFNQTMVIDCNVGTKPYQPNLLFFGIGPNVFISARGNCPDCQKSEFWGIPQTVWQALPAVLTFMLAN